MIDVHVLTHSGTKQEWLIECLESLKDEECTVHVIKAMEGNIIGSRANAFLLGNHKFCTFVDSDDYVLKGSMKAIVQQFEEKDDAVVAGELILTNGKLIGPSYGHHLFAVRRSALLDKIDELKSKQRYEHCTITLTKMFNPKVARIITYVWRRHVDQTSLKMHTWK